MPYRKQGIDTTENSLRISLSYLFKAKYIQKNSVVSGALGWSDNWGNKSGSISIQTCFKDSEKWIRLAYTITNNYKEEKINMDYKVYMTSLRSNLKKGRIYYLICPVSGNRCRILYMAYGSHYFKSRTAYRNRLYYNLQAVSKSSYSNERYFQLEKDIKKLENTRMKTTYRGNETKTYNRYNMLRNKMNYYDYKRYESMSNFLMKFQNKLKSK